MGHLKFTKYTQKNSLVVVGDLQYRLYKDCCTTEYCYLPCTQMPKVKNESCILRILTALLCIRNKGL